MAYAVQENLDFDAEVTVWSQSFFTPSSIVLSEMVAKAASFDFAVFVFAPDDLVRMRGAQHYAARDNVVFELGVFAGVLGVERCFIVMPRGTDAPRLPSDLLGLVPTTYNADRSDGSLVAALGASCNQIRNAIRTQRNAERPSVDTRAHEPYVLANAEDFLRAWESADMKDARAAVRTIPTDFWSDEFVALRPMWEKVVAFLESMSDAVIAGTADEETMFTAFGRAVSSVWPWSVQMRIPPGHGDLDDAVEPMPKLGELFIRWKGRDPDE